MVSVNDKLERLRKPRVHIRYEVETEKGTAERELPFVIGVMGDFSGHPEKPLPSLANRKFRDIDRENFDTVMGNIAPGVKIQVDNILNGRSDEKIAVALRFKSMDDFSPGKVIKNIEPLNKLLEARNKLRDLLAKAERAPDLEAVLERILHEPGAIDRVVAALDGDPKPETP